jgi:hypothetical protein
MIRHGGVVTSIRGEVALGMVSYPVPRNRNEVSIRVPRMFNSHVQQQYYKQVPCSIIQSNYLLHNNPWV